MLITIHRKRGAPFENNHAVFRVNENGEGYEKLLKAVRSVFAVPSKEEVKLSYYDEDGDEIFVGSFAELLEAKRLMPGEIKLELKNQRPVPSFQFSKATVKSENSRETEKSKEKSEQSAFRGSFFDRLKSASDGAASCKHSTETHQQYNREGGITTKSRWIAETSATNCSTVRPQKLNSSQSGRGKGRITLTCSTCKLRKTRGKALVKGVFVFFFMFFTTLAVMDSLFLETEQKASPELVNRLHALGVSDDRWVERLYEGFDCDEKELQELVTAMENERYRTMAELTSTQDCEEEDGIAETIDSYVWSGVEVWKGFPLHSRIIIFLLSTILSLFVLGPLPLVVSLLVVPVYYYCGGWQPLIDMMF